MRRKEIPPELLSPWRGFEAVLAEIEPGKAGITDVLPSVRLPGRPLAHALAEFEGRLTAASRLMGAWKVPQLQDDWEACDMGLSRSLSEVRRRLAEPPAIEGFEAMLGLVESLLDPLEPFAEAEATFRSLRRRPERAPKRP